MTDVGNYTAKERLRDGRDIEIRALRRTDRENMLAAIAHTSAPSLQRRFFAAKRHFSDAEIAFFMDIDFDNHVALVALLAEDGAPGIVGGARYVMVEDGRAEVAFLVVDAWQGRGIGRLLIKHLIGIAQQRGLHALSAEVLSGNAAMLRLLADFGLKTVPGGDFGTVHLLRALP